MLKVKLHFKNPHYIVSGNTVICQLDYYIDPDIFNIGINGYYYCPYTLIKKYPTHKNLIYCGRGKAVGRARCSEEDDFNEEKGKRIAESKATFKAHELDSRLLEEALKINTAKLEKLYRDNAISQSVIAIREYEHLKTLKL